jgi:hypothetical protein
LLLVFFFFSFLVEMRIFAWVGLKP